MKAEHQIVIYEPMPNFKLQVRTDGETVWLSQAQMVKLFGRDQSVIARHIRNIFRDGELERNAVYAKFAYTADDGKVYQVDFYNLDVVISVGYRVKSLQGTRFRQWATRMLRDMLLHRVEDMRRVDKLEGRVDTVETEIKQIKSGMTYLVKQLTAEPTLPKRRKIGFIVEDQKASGAHGKSEVHNSCGGARVPTFDSTGKMVGGK